METIWKVLITLGVFVLFLFAIVGTLAFIGGVDIPSMGNKVVIIPIKGEITSEGCGGSIFGSYQCAQVNVIKKRLKRADEDPTVKAIVLDINSGGGSVVASGELMRAIRETSKPVVAYIGESGASGAYYAASAADCIIADRNSITGSIGVIMSVSHYYELYEKIGINVTVIKAGGSKDVGSPYRPMSEDEKRELTEMVDSIHRDFIENVAENRNLTFEEVESVADGSIYLGITAKEADLIDEIGNLDDAIQRAAEWGGIEGEPILERAEPDEKISILDLFTKYQRNNINIKWAV